VVMSHQMFGKHLKRNHQNQGVVKCIYMHMWTDHVQYHASSVWWRYVVNLQRERKVQEGGARGRCIKGTRWCWISVLQQISLLWENALVCGERCMRKIWWLVKALCHWYNGEDCTHPHLYYHHTKRCTELH